MRKIAATALSVVLLGVWGCGGPPKLSTEQRKTIEYLEAMADQKENEAEKAEGLAKFHMDKAKDLREEAVALRQKARLVRKGQDLDAMERETQKGRW